MHSSTERLARIRTAYVRTGSSVAGPTVDALRRLVEEADRNGVAGRATVHIAHSPTEAVTVLEAVEIEEQPQ